MSALLQLVIAAPDRVLVDAGARSVRAEAVDGAFGVLPGHADLLTLLPPSVLRWREENGALRYCALRNGVLLVSGGARVEIACREGLVGDDLPALEAQVVAMRAEALDAMRRAQVEQTRLHAKAVRQILMRLQSQPGGGARPSGLEA